MKINKIIKKLTNKDFSRCLYLIIFIGFLVFVYLFSCSFFSKVFNKQTVGVNERQTILYHLVSSSDKENNPNKEISQAIQLADFRVIKNNISATNKKDDLIFNSFFDTFASGYLVDLEKTNLYLDYFSNAAFYPPIYSLEEINNNSLTNLSVSDFNFNKFGDSEADNFYTKRCLKNNCLESKERELFYNGKKLEYPVEMKTKNVVLVSLGAVDDSWFLGFTTKDSEYSGFVYSFDGQNFKRILENKNILSPYFGIFGFGGSEDDFLVIYGAQKGIAYRVQSQKITDISRFFDFRIMNKGFHPEVIKVENKYVTNWYIFSLSFGHPTLIKLWQNSNKDITGEMFYQDIWLSGEDSTSLYLFKNDNEKISLLLKSRKDENLKLKMFNDFGFNNNIEGNLFFKPVNLGKEVQIKKIANSLLGTQESPCLDGTLFFSTNQKEWTVIPQGYYVNKDFNPKSAESFYLKITLLSSDNKFYSSFLTEALFDFYYQK